LDPKISTLATNAMNQNLKELDLLVVVAAMVAAIVQAENGKVSKALSSCSSATSPRRIAFRNSVKLLPSLAQSAMLFALVTRKQVHSEVLDSSR
jgi:hypothetical protein